jgi:tetratricopeptide (TPR) repeat protein
MIKLKIGMSMKRKELKDSIKIRSGLHREIESEIVVGGKKYLILTEDIDILNPIITTRVYLGGKIVLTKTLNCRDITGTSAEEKKIIETVRGQHKAIGEALRKGNVRKPRSPSHFLEEVRVLLQRKDNKSALELLTQALKKYPDDPFLLSYFGCLEALINKNYTDGIALCKRAIELLNEKIPFGQEIFYPTFYLNLGRSYLAANNRSSATEALQKGLTFDGENKDLLWEMGKLGIRRKLVVPYLKRSNPLNKYIGMLLHKLGATPG